MTKFNFFLIISLLVTLIITYKLVHKRQHGILSGIQGGMTNTLKDQGNLADTGVFGGSGILFSFF